MMSACPVIGHGGRKSPRMRLAQGLAAAVADGVASGGGTPPPATVWSYEKGGDGDCRSSRPLPVFRQRRRKAGGRRAREAGGQCVVRTQTRVFERGGAGAPNLMRAMP
jgi:hypothetical protein